MYLDSPKHGDSDMANNNAKGSTKAKITAILLLIGAAVTAAAFYLDGDDTTQPDIGAVVDSAQDVKDQFGDDAIEP